MTGRSATGRRHWSSHNEPLHLLNPGLEPFVTMLRSTARSPRRTPASQTAKDLPMSAANTTSNHLHWNVLTTKRPGLSRDLQPGKEKLMWVANSSTLIYGERVR